MALFTRRVVVAREIHRVCSSFTPLIIPLRRIARKFNKKRVFSGDLVEILAQSHLGRAMYKLILNLSTIRFYLTICLVFSKRILCEHKLTREKDVIYCCNIYIYDSSIEPVLRHCNRLVAAGDICQILAYPRRNTIQACRECFRQWSDDASSAKPPLAMLATDRE